MVLIHAYRIVAASIDRVWDVISDIDRDPDFWRGTRHIKNISKTENTVEREVVIAFRNAVCQEIVTIDPKKSINIEIIEGPMKGKKTIALSAIENNFTRIDVEWDITINGLFVIFTRIIKRHILNGTQEALERISKKVILESQ
ncbi:MAG: type II toxin-antitoxin system RatA family toxin [Nitrososphaeraceae archaeon]|jgi:ribosome-associated toxin RatA of RatAB toxin-antitoxin module